MHEPWMEPGKKLDEIAEATEPLQEFMDGRNEEGHPGHNGKYQGPVDNSG